jgi:cell shape-determining protein MreD
MILSLLEISFTYLCLFLIINTCSMYHKGYRCVSWFFGLVLDQSMCRRNLGVNYVVFILICIIPLYAN